MKPTLLTFGCRLNTHESDGMAHYARNYADTVIVNTCAVTTSAERQARQAIRRLHRERPDAKIVVTGCASEIDATRWRALPGVTRVVPNAEKLNPETWGHATRELPPSRNARALLQVQQGCDHRCTFCIIPFGRGDSRSTSIAEAVTHARALCEAGHREIVLTGVDIASWAGAEDESLGTLCRALLRMVPEIARLRLSSIDPVALDPQHGDRDLWWLLENEPRLMPHLHLSLQAGADLILKRMKRRHETARVRALIRQARALRPDIGIGADLIAGFPTETEALFEETFTFIQEQAIPYLHVFPYSERPGTPAARMPAVPNAERQLRSARLRTLGETIRDDYLNRFVGRAVSVLIETAERGHSPEFAPVHLRGAVPPRGEIATAKVTMAENGVLLGEIF